MHTTATPNACSFMSPALVILARSGANSIAATSAIIIGGNLFSSNAITLANTRKIANSEGQTTWRNFMSGLSPILRPKRRR